MTDEAGAVAMTPDDDDAGSKEKEENKSKGETTDEEVFPSSETCSDEKGEGRRSRSFSSMATDTTPLVEAAEAVGGMTYATSVDINDETAPAAVTTPAAENTSPTAGPVPTSLSFSSYIRLASERRLEMIAIAAAMPSL